MSHAAMAAFAIEAARWSSPVVLALVMVDRAHLDLTAHRPDGDVSLELDSRVLDGPAIFPGRNSLEIQRFFQAVRNYCCRLH